jgi:hypothetical protein
MKQIQKEQDPSFSVYVFCSLFSCFYFILIVSTFLVIKIFVLFIYFIVIYV